MENNWLTVEQSKTMTVEGYPLNEIIAFAILCREKGITENDLHDFCLSFENGWKLGFEKYNEASEKMFRDMCERNAKVFSIPADGEVGE